MIKVEFILRGPEGHRIVREGRMPAIPRVGEVVAMGRGELSHMINQIQWDITEGMGEPLARIFIDP